MIRPRRFAAAALAAFAGGCVSVLPEAPPPPVLYPLTAAPADAAPAAPAHDLVVLIARPDAPRHLSGADIVWIRNGEIGFMEQSAWPDDAGLLLQALVVDAAQASGRFRAALSAGQSGRADLELRWDLTAFQIEEGSDGALNARFAATAKVIDGRTREVLATRAVSVAEPAAARTRTAAADALRRAAQAGGARIVAVLDAAAGVQPSAASTSR